MVRKIMKKILCTLMVVVMCLTSVPVGGLVGLDLSGFDFGTTEASAKTVASSGSCGDNVTYTYNSSTKALTISGTGEMSNYSSGYSPFYNSDIKSVVIESGVTSIGEYAFSGCTSLTSITIPDSVTSIGEDAFYKCTGLTSVTIPDSVTSIGDYAFSGCTSLTSITIPDSVTSIGSSAFEDCTSLTSITIPDSITSIDWGAFDGCTSLTSITVPDSVTSIGGDVFRDCASLTRVTIGNGVTSIDNWTFYGCTSLTSVTIPDSVTSIGDGSFWSCTSLTSVTIGNSVTSIDDDAFHYCTSLASVTIPDSVTSIGDHTFIGCNSLTSVTIPDSVTSIGDGAFHGCTSLTSVTIPDSVTNIGDHAFGYCTSLTSITVYSNNTKYSSDSYGVLFNKDKTELIQYPIGNNRTSYSISDGVTSIGVYAFCYCTNLTSITVDSNNTKYSSDSYGILFNKDKTELIQYPIGNKRTSYTIPDSVTSIGDDAFYCSDLTSVTIGNSVTSIGDWAFDDCTSLTSIAIPDSVTSIDAFAFNGCTSLKDVYYSGTQEQWNKISIDYGNDDLLDATIHFGTSGNKPNTSNADNTVYSDKQFTYVIDEVSGKVSLSFDPSWFSGDSSTYNHNLAKLTSKFAMLGYAASNDQKNALDLLGFNVESKNIYTNGKRDEENYFIADKTITVNGDDYVLVFAGLIGSHHEQWNSNFDPYGKGRKQHLFDDNNIEKGTTHLGFADARDFVYSKLNSYIKQFPAGTKIKLLLTGHSRGAAAANLLAAKLIDEGKIGSLKVSPSNIYTYTYATPNNTKDPDRTNDKYKRIFNIVNPTDFVTKVLPATKNWGFGKYGTVYTLPSKTNSNNYAGYKKAMLVKYYQYTNDSNFADYQTGEAPVIRIVERLTDAVDNLDEFYEKNIWCCYAINGSLPLIPMNKAYDFFQETLCPFVNGSDIVARGIALAKALQYQAQDPYQIGICSRMVGFFIANQVVTSEFEDQHLAATYCAYVTSMSESQIRTKRYSLYNAVNCPVDIEIYNKETGELVGKVVNNVVDEEIAAKDSAVVVIVEGDSKQFYLPGDGEYEIKLIGNDNGKMDYTVATIDSDIGETERINFFDVDITDGLTMTATVNEDTSIDTYELALKDGSNLKPSEKLLDGENLTYSITTNTDGEGYVTESMSVTSGNYVTLDACATQSSEFVGWYENNELVCDDSTYSFVAKSDRTLTAKFKHVHTPIVLDAVAPTCTNNGLTEGKICSGCGEVFTEQETIPPHRSHLLRLTLHHLWLRPS